MLAIGFHGREGRGRLLGIGRQGKVVDMIVERRTAFALGLSLVCLSGGLLLANQTVASPQKTKSPETRGNTEAGREIFNGKAKLPQLASDTAALIAQLNPPPADLRDPKTLRLNSDKARASAIREGHPGTGMFPTTTLTNQELTDAVSYLATLRKEGHAAANSVVQSGDGSPRLAQGAQGDKQAHPSTGDSKRGEELYKASCIVCHGPRAEGGIGPKLASNPVLANDQAFWKIVHEGRHMMPPLKGTVTDQQFNDIRAWLRMRGMGGRLQSCLEADSCVHDPASLARR